MQCEKPEYDVIDWVEKPGEHVDVELTLHIEGPLKC